MKRYKVLFGIIIIFLCVALCGVVVWKNKKQEHTNPLTIEEMMQEICDPFGIDIAQFDGEYTSKTDENGRELKRTYRMEEPLPDKIVFEYVKERNALHIICESGTCDCEFDGDGTLVSILACGNSRNYEYEFFYHNGKRAKVLMTCTTGSGLIDYSEERLYDTDGKLYKVIKYDALGEKAKITEYSDNKKQKATIFETDYYCIEEYGLKSERIKSTCYDYENVLKNSVEYEHDEDGLEIKGLIYGADGSLEGWFENEYDGLFLKKTTNYNSAGEVIDEEDYPLGLLDILASFGRGWQMEEIDMFEYLSQMYRSQVYAVVLFMLAGAY